MLKTMSPEEAEAVLRLHMERGGDPANVRIEDVAEALRVTPMEVENLLSQVRAGQAKDQFAEHKARDQRRLIWSLVVSVLIVAIGLAAFGAFSDPGSRLTSPAVAVMRDANEQLPPVPVEESDFGFSEAEKVPPSGALPQMRLGIGPNSVVIPASGLSAEAVTQNVETWLSHAHSRIQRSPEADRATLHRIKGGSFDDPAIGHQPVWCFYGEDRNDGGFTLPVYDGTNTEIEKLVGKERARRIAIGLRYP